MSFFIFIRVDNIWWVLHIDYIAISNIVIIVDIAILIISYFWNFKYIKWQISTPLLIICFSGQQLHIFHEFNRLSHVYYNKLNKFIFINISIFIWIINIWLNVDILIIHFFITHITRTRIATHVHVIFRFNMKMKPLIVSSSIGIVV